MIVLWVALGWLAVAALVLSVARVAGREAMREEHRTAGELGRRSRDSYWWLDEEG